MIKIFYVYILKFFYITSKNSNDFNINYFSKNFENKLLKTFFKNFLIDFQILYIFLKYIIAYFE